MKRRLVRGRWTESDGNNVETVTSESIGKQRMCDSSVNHTNHTHTQIRPINFMESVMGSD